MSHSFLVSLQSAPFFLNIQSSQQAPILHWACACSLHVTGSQQLFPLSVHSFAVPQSHSSPRPRIPSPQTGPSNRSSGAFIRHEPSPLDNPSLNPSTLQLLNSVAGSRLMRLLITHPRDSLALHAQWGRSSSWYIPNTWPSSCANVCAVNAASPVVSRMIPADRFVHIDMTCAFPRTDSLSLTPVKSIVTSLLCLPPRFLFLYLIKFAK